MPQLLLIDDEKLILWGLKRDLEGFGYTVEAFSSCEEAFPILEKKSFDVALIDVRLPGISGIEMLDKIKKLDPEIPVIMITAFADVEVAVSAIRKGSFDFILKPFTLEKMRLTILNALSASRMKREIATLKMDRVLRHRDSPLLWKSAKMREVFENVERIGKMGANVIFLTGESGAGKGMIAHKLFQFSPRSQRPFIEINCGAIPDTLFESEFFGHERGAFTGAVNSRKGYLEMADGGTIFLDEVSEIPIVSQRKFLKALEEQTIWRVGGSRSIKIDVNIIAASNRDLQQEIKENRFREDLFYRLNIIPIHLPPLRERDSDILLLADFFLESFQAKYQREFNGFGEEAKVRMNEYAWPGNVRELKNCVERAVVLEQSKLISSKSLGLSVSNLTLSSSKFSENSNNPIDIPAEGFNLALHLENIERQFLEKALNESKNNQSVTARKLGMTRDILRYRLKKYQLDHT